jgi:hypothetical protein
VAQVVSGRSKTSYRKPYLNPLLSLDQLARSTRQALKLKVMRWLRLFRGLELNAVNDCWPKNYDQPQARIVTLEQARLLALGSLGLDDKENRFMQLLFSDWCENGKLPVETQEKNEPEDDERKKSGEPLTVDRVVTELCVDPLEPAASPSFPG